MGGSFVRNISLYWLYGILFANFLAALCRLYQIAAYASESCDLCSGKKANTTFSVSVLYCVLLELIYHLFIQ